MPLIVKQSSSDLLISILANKEDSMENKLTDVKMLVLRKSTSETICHGKYIGTLSNPQMKPNYHVTPTTHPSPVQHYTCPLYLTAIYVCFTFITVTHFDCHHCQPQDAIPVPFFSFHAWVFYLQSKH